MCPRNLPSASGLDDALLKPGVSWFYNTAKETVAKWRSQLNLILLNALSVKNFFIRKNKKYQILEDLASQIGTTLLSTERLLYKYRVFNAVDDLSLF